MREHFRQAVDSDLFGRRLAYLYAALFDPDLILPYIQDKDEYLVRQVETDNLASNAALFLCAAYIEETVDSQTFTGRAENTVRSYLHGEFVKRDWDWPTHPVVWKQYFLDQHIDELF